MQISSKQSLLVFVIAGFWISNAFGAVIFMATPPIGDDANPGTRAAPVATLGRALAIARQTAGDDTIRVVAGTYAGDTIDEPRLILQGEPGVSFTGLNIVGAGNVQIRDVTIFSTNAPTLFAQSANGLIVERSRFTAEGGDANLVIQNSNRVTVRYNTLVTTAQTNINADNVRFFTAKDNIAVQAAGARNFLIRSPAASFNLIEGNNFLGNSAFAVDMAYTPLDAQTSGRLLNNEVHFDGAAFASQIGFQIAGGNDAVTGNSFQASGSTATPFTGIRFQDATFARVRHNHFLTMSRRVAGGGQLTGVELVHTPGALFTENKWRNLNTPILLIADEAEDANFGFGNITVRRGSAVNTGCFVNSSVTGNASFDPFANANVRVLSTFTGPDTGPGTPQNCGVLEELEPLGRAVSTPVTGNIFSDGFESGDTTRWNTVFGAPAGAAEAVPNVSP